MDNRSFLQKKGPAGLTDKALEAKGFRLAGGTDLDRRPLGFKSQRADRALGLSN
ncbi:MAG: hypothetical protein IH977_10570 [Nitrospinae bacterium]|nr:hypothetical protein [Nitrospinota bacterium]